MSRVTPAPGSTAVRESPLGDAASPTALEALLNDLASLSAMRAAADDLRSAVASLAARQSAPALAKAQQALAKAPDLSAAWHVAAIAHEKLENWREALDSYAAALARDPENVSIGNDLGRLAYALRLFPEAERLFRIHQGQLPGSVESAVNLGNLLREQARFQEAIDILKPAAQTHPDDPGLWNALGALMTDMGEVEQANAFFSEALRLNPDLETALYNRSATLALMGDIDGAIADCRTALNRARTPEHRVAMQFALALLLLGHGQLAEGWDAYESRLDPEYAEPIHFLIDRPRWSPDDAILGKRLLLIGEQGLGDEILFANMLDDIQGAIGPEGRLILAVEPRLVGLFRRSFPNVVTGAHGTIRRGARVIRAVPFVGDAAGVDLWAPMASPLRRFRRQLADFPERPGGLMRADPVRVAYWREQLDALPGRKIGLLWSSLVMTGARSRYFSPFEAWRPVLETAGVTFVNLQYGDREDDLAYAREHFGVEIVTLPGLNLKDDLDEVAALSCALDLVLGVSNATFNIAAACGAQAWLVAPAGLWTQFGTSRHPWYSQVRVFHAPAPNAWEPLMREVAAALSTFVHA